MARDGDRDDLELHRRLCRRATGGPSTSSTGATRRPPTGWPTGSPASRSWPRTWSTTRSWRCGGPPRPSTPPGARSARSSCPWCITGRSTRSGARSGSANGSERAANLEPAGRRRRCGGRGRRGRHGRSAASRSVRRSRRSPPEQRQVLEMAYFQGMTQVQIAEELGIPLGTVKTRTLAAMRKLRAAALHREDERDRRPRSDRGAAGRLRPAEPLGRGRRRGRPAALRSRAARARPAATPSAASRT